MSHPPNRSKTGSCLRPELVADLLDLVAEHDVDHALRDIEHLLARLRDDAEDVAAAREVLRNTPAPVLRQALRVRAARRVEAAR